MARSLLKFLVSLAVTTLVVSCAPKTDAEPPRAPTLAGSGSLQPYQTPSPSAIAPSATPIPTRTPFPTATPHLYTVESGDTMGSIALEFGLDMGDLVNANPDVSPYTMSIGQELIIPDGEQATAITAVEPLELPFADPVCYATLGGGMWCFVLVQNDTEGVVEGISFELQLYGVDGNLLATETAFPLLDRLPAGEMTPALVYFANVPVENQVYARLLTAFEGVENNESYLAASLQGVFTQIAWDGKSARVSGEVLVDGEVADQIWVVATAYSADGAVVGVRRWEYDSGGQMFDLTVASLGPEIDYVLLSVEAHR